MYLSNDQADRFFSKVLEALDADQSVINVSFLLQWREAEQNPVDPSTDWNPLNTTRAYEADNMTLIPATDFNSAGVKNYPDEATGVRATVLTLSLPYYRNIVAAFKSNFSDVPNWATIAGEIDTWGTHPFARELDAGWRPSANDPRVTAIPQPTPTPDTTPEVSTDVTREEFDALKLQVDRQNTAILARVGAIRDAIHTYAVETYPPVNPLPQPVANLLAALDVAADPAHVPGDVV